MMGLKCVSHLFALFGPANRFFQKATSSPKVTVAATVVQVAFFSGVRNKNNRDRERRAAL
jgi:hypothetical protein